MEGSKEFECSFLVCIYRPEWEKLRLTLKSCLLQKDCRCQIVITDDGSENNFFNEAEAYLREHNFSDYEMVAASQNHGTVKNVMQGLKACRGTYVKPISPGDFMHGQKTMRRWLDFMDEHDDCAMTFGDAIYYHFAEGKLVPTAEYAHPQCIDICGGGTSLRNYLMYNDICLGASTLLRRQVWQKYLQLLIDKVIYAEDHTYRLMKYAGEKFSYFPEKVILYEFGSGISTNGSAVWSERLRRDWEVADGIILSTQPCSEAKKMRLPEFLQVARVRGWGARLKRLYLCPTRVFFGVKQRFLPRSTSVVVDDDFVARLLEE